MTNDNRSVFLSILMKACPAGFSIGTGFVDNEPVYVHSTYSKKWVDTYVDRSFLLEDPTIIHGQTHLGHFTWAQLQDLYPDNPVFPAAAEFGMVEGNTLSLRIEGVRTIVSGAGPKWSEDELRQIKAAASGIHHLVSPLPTPCVLTAKEQDVVRLMAQGLKDEEIANSLSIKTETVRLRRRVCYKKTATSSPASLLSYVIENAWV